MSRIETSGSSIETRDCRPTDWLGAPRVVAADACVDSSAMDDNVWEVLEQACDLTPFTQNSSEGRWYISSQIFKDRGQFCVSQALCKLDTWANYADDHFVIDALGGDYDVDVSDEDNPTTLGQIVGKLKECGFEGIDPELLHYVGSLNFFSGFDAARIKKIVVGLQNTANNMCIADEANYFLGEVFKSGASDNRFAKLALVNSLLNEAIAGQKPIDSSVEATLLEALGNSQSCAVGNLHTLIIERPANAADELKNYVLEKAIRAAKIPPQPKDCSAFPNTHPSEDNKQCMCDVGYELRADKSGCDLPPPPPPKKRPGKKPAASGQYNPFEE